jgi:hypothetical protein
MNQRKSEGYEDEAGYDWLAGNLITEATAAKKDRGVIITAEERTTARKIYHRLAELLRESGHEVTAEQPGRAVAINKRPGGGIEIKLSYEGFVGNSGDVAVTAVTHLLKGAALAMTAMGKPTRVAGDKYSLRCDSLPELASVLDIITPDAEKRIGAPPMQRHR